MKIKSIIVGPLETNCYIVWDEISRRALIIDPGDEPEKILEFLDRTRLDAAAYVVTHGHMDHIGALAGISAQKPAPIGMHQADAQWAFSAMNRIFPDSEIPERPAEIARSLEDGQTWDDIGTVYQVIASPGHSPGGVCLYFPDERVLFSGDTLFKGSIGRTDLPGGDCRLFEQSLRKLAGLPGETIVYPGHGPDTSIEYELRNNPFLGCNY